MSPLGHIARFCGEVREVLLLCAGVKTAGTSGDVSRRHLLWADTGGSRTVLTDPQNGGRQTPTPSRHRPSLGLNPRPYFSGSLIIPHLTRDKRATFAIR